MTFAKARNSLDREDDWDYAKAARKLDVPLRPDTQELNMSDKDEPDEQDAALQPFTSTIGDVQLAEKLFGNFTEITWLKNTDGDYSCMTLTRGGEIR